MRYRPALAIGLLVTALAGIGCGRTAPTAQAPAIVAPSPAPPPEPQINTIEKPLVEERAHLYAARPFGNGAVYIQEDLDKPDISSEVRYYDPTIGQPQVVAKTVTPRGHVDVPAGDWPWLVWVDWSQGSGRWSLFAHNVQSGARLTLAASGVDGSIPSQAPPMPSISGTQIVWSEMDEATNTDLFLYDIARQERRRLTNSGDTGRAEVVAGRVIFERGSHEDQAINGLWSLDLATGQQRQVVKGYVSDFGFGGRYLAYAEAEPMAGTSRNTLFLLDMQTGERRQLAPTTAPGQSFYIAVGDEWVVWHRSEYTRLHAYSPAHPEQIIEVPRMVDDGYIRHPALSGKNLIWLGIVGSRPLGTQSEMVYQLWLK